MPVQNDIETVVGLIETGHIGQAVAVWMRLRQPHQHCSPCFFTPLDAAIRCTSCLESNLSTALLKRDYTQVGQDRLQAARDSLTDWLAASAQSETA